MTSRKTGSTDITQTKSAAPNSEMAVLIEKLQKNADKVERNITEVEANLNKDVSKLNEGKERLYKADCAKKTKACLDLLDVLDKDATTAKCLQHPQAEMIEQDMKQLRERVMKLKVDDERISHLSLTECDPTNWSCMMDEKLKILSSKGFGQDLPSVEEEVEEHNIFHREVEALAPFIAASKDKEHNKQCQEQYNKLLADSAARKCDLADLRDYMLGCTNELYWMEQQAEERINYDWSDTNPDYLARQRQYENFISKCLESKEATITKLNDDGEKLIAKNHPAKNVIEAHMEAVHADWKEYLNLLICEENHLKHMDEYHKYHKEAQETQTKLKELEKDVNQKYNHEFKDKYQIEGLISELDDQLKAVDNLDEEVNSLQTRSLQVLPLKYRRETQQRQLLVEALCEFDTEEGPIMRGERYTLLRNNGSKWDVKDAAGRKINAPAVCFMIPPTDPEAVDKAKNLAKQQKGLNQKIESSKDSLRKHLNELQRESGAGLDKEEQQCRQLMAGLDKGINDLDKQEKAIYSQIRPPLEQSRPLQDSADRLQKIRDTATVVSRIEPDKTAKVQEAKNFLRSNPKSASAPQLNSKVDEADKKCAKVQQLLQYSQDRLKTSNQLETSLQNSKDMLSDYENKLAREEAAPADIDSLEKKLRDLAHMEAELRANRPLITETEQNLRSAKSASDDMCNKFQEHAPDIKWQEAEVQKLNKRFNNLLRQIDTRSQILQRIKMASNNYSLDYNNLNTWLSRVPNYEPRETDDIKQVETKLKNQKNLLSDIARKESDLNNVSKNAQLYQQAIKDYENELEKFKATPDIEDGLVPQTYKRARMESPALRVKAEEAAIAAKFTEVKAVNTERQKYLEYTQNLLKQQPDINMIQATNVKSVNAAPGEEQRLRKQVYDEKQRCQQLEKEVETIQTEIYILEGQKPQDTIVKKELIKKVPDPQLDEELHKGQQKLSEERRTTNILENDLEVLKLKERGLETEVKEGAQEYTVKEVLRIERDRGQEEEVRKLRDELDELRRQKLMKDNELIEFQKQVTILAEEKSREQEVITEEEVIKVQNDPQLETEYRFLLDKKQKEIDGRKQLEDELHFLQEKLRRLEKEKSMAEEKISIKEVIKVEKDVALEREVDNLRRQREDEKTKLRSSHREKADLQRKIASLEEEKSKVIIQEKVREIVRPDPKSEKVRASLQLELVEQQRRYKEYELQCRCLQDELTMLRNRGPRVEVKETIKEVIKYKIDPQTEGELEKLRNEIVDKTHQTEKNDMEICQLRDEIQRWKDTKPQVQTKEVVNEVLQYREDPKTKEEIETLKRKLADEQKKRLDLERERAAQEEKIRLKKTELSQVREKIVQQEVVKMEEDPVLRSECETFLQNINAEQRQRESLKAELYQLQRQKADLDMQLEELDRERKMRREAELEIQRLRVRLHELELRDKENREKVTVKQTVKLQQDPQQEKEHSMIKLQLEEEQHKRILLEKELNALIQQQLTLEKVDVKERVVRTEKVQVEKDPEAEIEIENLKRTLEEEKRRRRELDQELSDLTSKFSEMEFTNTKSSKELSYIQDDSNRLQQENQRLQNEIRKLRSEIEITSKETQLITESAPSPEKKNLELRLESLQRELSDLRSITYQKELEIEKLKKNLAAVRMKREQRESHLKRSIVIIDPDTGKEMKPDEAYQLGLIDWKMLVNLQNQECDWEEISIKGPKGESSVLHDRKSGKKFSIDDALRLGHITNNQLQQYQNKQISIQEFATMVCSKKQ